MSVLHHENDDERDGVEAKPAAQPERARYRGIKDLFWLERELARCVKAGFNASASAIADRILELKGR